MLSKKARTISICGKNIKWLRTRSNFTQERLSEKLNVFQEPEPLFEFTRKHIESYETGVAQKPNNPRKLEVIANFFGVEVERLLDVDLQLADQQAKQQYERQGDQNILHFSRLVNCGLPPGPSDSEQNEVELYYQLPHLFRWVTYHSFSVRGHSMEPHIPDGCTLVCEPDKVSNDLIKGEVYVLSLTNGDGLVCKRVYREKDRLLLVSDNFTYEPYTVGLDEVNAILKPVEIIKALPN